MALNRTGIETADFTWNLYTGYLRKCPFCWARKLARGWLKRNYLCNSSGGNYSEEISTGKMADGRWKINGGN